MDKVLKERLAVALWAFLMLAAVAVAPPTTKAFARSAVNACSQHQAADFDNAKILKLSRVSPVSYRVENIARSVEFRPGQIITARNVEELCAARAWNVTVAPVKSGR